MRHGGPVRLLVVDDDVLTMGMLSASLEGLGYRVATASSSSVATVVAADFRPQLAIIDLDLGRGPSGVELAHQLRRRNPGIGILIATTFRSTRLVGATSPVSDDFGFIVKGDIVAVDVLRRAVEQELSGSGNRFRRRLTTTPANYMITKTQAEVLRLLSQGYNNAAIAKQRGTSLRSVEIAIQRIYQRLCLSDEELLNPRVEAVLKYLRGEIGVTD